LSPIHCKTPDRRRGLAPLELVLALPLLLMVMGLMVFFGNAAYWKVRGSTVARHAAWSTRWPRMELAADPPRNWQPGAMGLNDAAAPIEDLDDPSIQHPVVRGPLDNGFQVDEELLDMSRGVVEGEADITRTPAMLAVLGDFQYDLSHPLLDDKFQYLQMEIPANRHRRIPTIYELPKADAALSQAFVESIRGLLGASFRRDLRPLDDDDEIYALLGYRPDFHPRIGFCSVEYDEVWQNDVQDLIGRIKGRRRPDLNVPGVPERMTSFHLGMYRRVLREIQQGERQPPPSTTELQQKIDVLQRFRAQLRNRPDTNDGPRPSPLGPPAGIAPSGA
jgi:hypothetical protein